MCFFVRYRENVLSLAWNFVMLLLLLALLSFNLYIRPAESATVTDAPKLTATAAILINANNGIVYFEKNAKVQRHPASLTKIMTGIVVLDTNIANEIVQVSPEGARVSMGSLLNLNTGDKLPVESLLKAALIISANDSTVALAEHYAGREDMFIEVMNAKAFLVGMPGTRYANTNGFSAPNHYTTAYDLANLTRYALKNPNFAKLVSTRDTSIKLTNKHGKVKTEVLSNTNRFLSMYPGANGVKTGTTAKAGNCLITSVSRDGKKLIAVVLKSQNRYADSYKLMEYGFKTMTN